MCNWSEAIAERWYEDGIEDGVRRVIENALKNGSTPEDIAKVTFISLDEIIRIQEEKLVGTK